jgi:hypothetical protein
LPRGSASPKLRDALLVEARHSAFIAFAERFVRLSDFDPKPCNLVGKRDGRHLLLPASSRKKDRSTFAQRFASETERRLVIASLGASQRKA